MNGRAWCVICKSWLPISEFEPLALRCRFHEENPDERRPVGDRAEGDHDEIKRLLVNQFDLGGAFAPAGPWECN